MRSWCLAVLQILLTTDELKAWGWRIPFVIGAMAAIVAMYLRRSLAETASEEAMHSKEAGSVIELVAASSARSPDRVCLHDGRLALFLHVHHLHAEVSGEHGAHGCQNVTFVMTVVLVVFMLLQPVFGALSDRIGRKNNMILFTALGALAAVPLICARSASPARTSPFCSSCSPSRLPASTHRSAALLKPSYFPPQVRALGVGLTYAVANALFGGTAEYVALWLKSAGQEQWFCLVRRRDGRHRACRLADHA